MTLLERVATQLSARAIRHAVIGAAALAARGVARSTYDIDLLVTDVRALDRETWTTLEKEGVAVDIRRGDADDPLRGVVRLEAARERPVDVVVGRHAWQTRAIEHAESSKLGPPVVTARDLILLKLYAGGSQDLWDIRELLRLQGRAVLVANVSDAVADLTPAMQAMWRDVSTETFN